LRAIIASDDQSVLAWHASFTSGLLLRLFAAPPAGHDAKIQATTGPATGKFVAKATVYTGPFTVHSHTHPLKYQRGYFQFSFFDEEKPADDDIEDLPRLGDETYKFEFIAKRPAHY
jgi:hypothetical protein